MSFRNNNNNRKFNNRNRGQRPRQDDRPGLQFTPQGEKVDALIRHAARLVRMLVGRHSAGELLASQVKPKTMDEELRARLQPDMRALSGEFVHTLDRITSGGSESILTLWLQELTVGHTDATPLHDEEDSTQNDEVTADPALTGTEDDHAASQISTDPVSDPADDEQPSDTDD